MLCKVCKDGLEGIWDPRRTKRLALVKDFLSGKGSPISQDPGDRSPGSEDLQHQVSTVDDTAQAEHSGIDEVAAGTRPDEYVFAHHKTEASFISSVREGCVMCNRFRGDRDPNPEDLGYFSVFLVNLPRGAETAPKPVMFIHIGQTSGGFDLVPVGDPRYDSHLNFDFSQSNHDAKSWSLIENWMTTCLESHSQCKRPTASPPSFLPTRLLKLDISQSLPSFRLVLGSECPPKSSYVALSYCWGTKPVDRLLRLLQSTTDELSRDQPVNSLPKTFRDAMETTQRFGVSYLWIDRLCIFQDSPEDWKSEASSMQDVYKNALFCISALGAEDDDGGCFFQRDPSLVAPTIVRVKLEDDGDERAFRFSLERGWAWRLFFDNEPLIQRSWVLQERLLSRRTLHFGSKQLFWECCEASCCETHPQGVYGILDIDDADDDSNGDMAAEEERQMTQSHHHQPLWKQLLDAPAPRPAGNQYKQLFTDWNLIMISYASRRLTIPSDKLVAISGLANDMKTRLQQLKPGSHRYLAGIWEETLMDTIAWNVTTPARRALEYRAPSWAWACLDGNINLPSNENGSEAVMTIASMDSVQMAYIGEEDTGEVESAVLTLTGPFAALHISEESDWMYPNEKPVDGIRRPDSARNFGKEDGTPDRLRVLFDTVDDIRSEVHLLWVGAHHWSKGQWYASGLALRCVERNKYQRIGIASCYFASKGDARVYVDKFPRRQVMIV